MTNFFLIKNELLILRRSIADHIDLSRLDKAIAEIDRAALMEQERVRQMGEKDSAILHLTRALSCYINSNSIG